MYLTLYIILSRFESLFPVVSASREQSALVLNLAAVVWRIRVQQQGER
jgi:hypothetical protein